MKSKLIIKLTAAIGLLSASALALAAQTHPCCDDLAACCLQLLSCCF